MAQAQGVNYDRAAGEYAAHRRVHGGVFRELSERAGLGPASRVLEVGCGTGNYASALTGRYRMAAYGLDPSAGMLLHACAHPESVIWLQGRAESPWRWIVDPIDGTSGFVRGIPVWASLIALVVDGRPALGVVSAPALGVRWWGG